MRYPAFTLIELLVVIAIIALLMAVLVPVLHSTRQSAKTALCSSNIKQLLLGLSLYENENKTLPYALDDTPGRQSPPGGYPGFIQYDRAGWWWFSYIEGYYNKAGRRKTVLFCPSKKLINPNLKNNILCGNYGVNQSICKSATGRRSRAEFIGTPLRSSGIKHPGRTLLVVDSGYSMINWWHAADKPPLRLDSSIIEDTAYIPGLEINKERDFWPGQQNDAINGRHPNRTVNVGFADGHIGRKKADDLFVEKIDDGYKNRSPLWLPK